MEYRSKNAWLRLTAVGCVPVSFGGSKSMAITLIVQFLVSLSPLRRAVVPPARLPENNGSQINGGSR